jgi:hypothetical protein
MKRLGDRNRDAVQVCEVKYQWERDMAVVMRFAIRQAILALLPVICMSCEHNGLAVSEVKVGGGESLGLAYVLESACRDKDPNRVAWAVIGIGLFSRGTQDDIDALTSAWRVMGGEGLPRGIDWPDTMDAEIRRYESARSLKVQTHRPGKRNVTLRWLIWESMRRIKMRGYGDRLNTELERVPGTVTRTQDSGAKLIWGTGRQGEGAVTDREQWMQDPYGKAVAP